jgi:peptidoglycan-associated lipoprotein
MQKASLVGWAAIATLLGATACQTATTPSRTFASEPETTALPDVTEVAAGTTPEVALRLDSVYFDYDRWELREDARRTLKQNAGRIQSAAASEKLVVEGHCDERGSEEYNLALGDRRAAAVVRYLTDLGVPASSLRSVSFGESQPAAPGHDEDAWQRNRRSEIRVESQTAQR